MADLDNLNRQLDEFEITLPGLLIEYPSPADHWPAIAGELDVIEDAAGEHAAHVSARIDAILARHGLTLVRADTH